VRHVTWTIERIETLSQYRHDGLSAAQVSHRMGSSRSSVLGIIKRMRDYGVVGFGGFEPTPDQRYRTRGTRRKTSPRRGPSARLAAIGLGLPLFDMVMQIPGSRRIPLLNAAVRECRWLDDIADGETPTRCGVLTDKGVSYCSGRRALVYRAGTSAPLRRAA
jgi:hypothetical protein